MHIQKKKKKADWSSVMTEKYIQVLKLEIDGEVMVVFRKGYKDTFLGK